MAETATWDRVSYVRVTIIREISPLGDAQAFIEYGLVTAAGDHPINRGGFKATLDATNQTRANAIMALALSAVKAREGIP